MYLRFFVLPLDKSMFACYTRNAASIFQMRRRCSRDDLGCSVRPAGFSPPATAQFPPVRGQRSCSAFLRCRRFLLRWLAGARSTGCSLVRLPPFRAARSPGSWFGGPPFGGAAPGWVFRPSVSGALTRPLVPGSPLTQHAVAVPSTLARAPIEEPPFAGALNFAGNIVKFKKYRWKEPL